MLLAVGGKLHGSRRRRSFPARRRLSPWGRLDHSSGGPASAGTIEEAGGEEVKPKPLSERSEHLQPLRVRLPSLAPILTRPDK